MGELLPTLAARTVRDGLVEYLETTFALADDPARRALNELLEHPQEGIFKGPYLRLRLPFAAAPDGWRDVLGWHPADDDPRAFPPYGHQARAFARLSSLGQDGSATDPRPTLVTTGTGSGKTEAFLYPILDHVLRAKRQGVTGTKALLLYPMNALANDQGQRLAELLTTHPSLTGITAGLYTGQAGPQRTTVRPDGLITDRHVLRSSAPDILLTNYKMLDQLLLRPADSKLWSQSATSLRYLVLDEFHTYDGAQGTDVAMLLRRLGLALRAHGRGDAGPLAGVTPVATSATLGDGGDPTTMRAFAETVFGVPFADDAVVTESRLTVDEWVAGGNGAAPGDPVEGRALVDGLLHATETCGLAPEPAALAAAVAPVLYATDTDGLPVGDLVRAHPLTRALLATCTEATALTAVAATAFPDAPVDDARKALETFVAVLTHVRATVGRSMPSVELHLWVRELTRIDREVASAPAFAWGDDGGVPLDATIADDGTLTTEPVFPALYCRNCGRSGWGVTVSPADSSELDQDDAGIRREHAQGKGRFRPLIHATREHEVASAPDDAAPNLRWFAPRDRRILHREPETTDGHHTALPVLVHTGEEAREASQRDDCPACGQRDGIRFLGSAVATQLSVALSTLFGSTNIDTAEKKTLVFTDSVQDAAHRAGFVQSRSHGLTVRSVLREAIGDDACTLDELPDRVLQHAGDDPVRRARILPPDLIERKEFLPFWERKTLKAVPTGVRNRVRRRILFDAQLEFGLQSRTGRTLERTGTIAAQVVVPAPVLLAAGRRRLEDGEIQLGLDGPVTDAVVVAWVRGVLEHLRHRGGIAHEWLQPYIKEDGSRFRIWRGRRRGDGMPAFPIGRTAPAFARVGPEPKHRDRLLDQVTGAQGWYAQWASRAVGVTAREGTVLTRQLFAELARKDVVEVTHNDKGADVYALRSGAVLLESVSTEALAARERLLVCDTCRGDVPGTAEVIDQLEGAPCLVTRCTGHLVRDGGAPENFYRRFYEAHEVQRVIAREHTSMLDDAVRLAHENGFKGRSDDPQAPNVLVSTPTLEMGIDIGDLSTVVLASLPKTVAGYTQRVGRAGRLSGSALNLAFVTGRGQHLPLLGDPTSLINGAVRPPATYLDAVEILRRQYLATIADEEAREPGGSHPATADEAVGAVGPTSYFGALIARGEVDPGATNDADAPDNAGATDSATNDPLEGFLAAFPSLGDDSRAELREWARPVDGPGTSPLARRVLAAQQRWRQQLEELGHRITVIEQAIPDLKRVAEVPAATDDDRHALRTAEASLKLAGRQRAELRGQYWISVLERLGLFPNYTLLGDDVTLDVGLSWQDPDSGAFETDTHDYRRSTALALREFAPGATFYAGGYEVEINAVELGSAGDAVRTLALCPHCGYDEDVTGRDNPVTCTRCDSPDIADAGQRLDVVEMRRVSSTMRRDEARIDDARDDRVRERFDVTVTADVAPENVTDEWYVDGSGFGVRHVRDLRLRWLNLGRADGQGAPRFIAGRQLPAGLFRLCAECGQVDGRSGRNNPHEHRPWCSRRKADDEHTVSIALSRMLTTEGLFVRLPTSAALGTTFAVPSLAAAIKLGLREHLGGDPDHLSVELVTDPGNGGTDAVLLHDDVPGGTGYLAELANPESLRGMLSAAYEVVRDCPCADEGRLACHRCLLPFAPWSQEDTVARSEAERHLWEILTDGDDDADPDGSTWTLRREPPADFDPESKMEQQFRDVLRQRLETIGATITAKPLATGERWEINLGAGRRWSLQPQVNVLNSKPDFVLRSQNPTVPRMAIFCDGWRYHATPETNRLHDDAAKRDLLREAGWVVLSLVWDDLKPGGGAPGESWFSDATASTLMASGRFGLSPGHLDLARRGPLDLLVSWIQQPDPDGLRALGRAVPFLLSAQPQTRGGRGDDTVDLAATGAALLDGGELPQQGPNALIAWTDGPVALVARIPVTQDPDGVEVALVLDDRPAAVADFDTLKPAWRTWLHLGNLLGLRTLRAAVTVWSLATVDGAVGETSASPGDGVVPDDASGTPPATTGRAAGVGSAPTTTSGDVGTPAGGDAAPLSPAWQHVVDAAADDGRALLVALAAAGIPAPDDEPEVEGIPLGPSWIDARVTLDIDLLDDEPATLRAAGWTVVAPDPDAVRTALEGAV